MQGAGINDSVLLGKCRLSLSDIISLTCCASSGRYIDGRECPHRTHLATLLQIGQNELQKDNVGRQGLAATTKLLAQLSAQLSAPPVRLFKNSV